MVPELAEPPDDGGVPIPLPHPRHLIMGQLDPGQALVVADAELAEPLLAEKRLGGVHLAELLGRDAIAVLEA